MHVIPVSLCPTEKICQKIFVFAFSLIQKIGLYHIKREDIEGILSRKEEI